MAFDITPDGSSAIEFESTIDIGAEGQYLLKRPNYLPWELKETIDNSPVAEGSYIRFRGKKHRLITGCVFMLISDTIPNVDGIYDLLAESIKENPTLVTIDDDQVDRSVSNVRILRFEMMRRNGARLCIPTGRDGMMRSFVAMDAIQLAE